MIQIIVCLEYEALFHLARHSPALTRNLNAVSLLNYDNREPRLIIRLNLLAGRTYFPEFNCQDIGKLAILKTRGGKLLSSSTVYNRHCACNQRNSIYPIIWKIHDCTVETNQFCTDSL